MRVGTAEFDDVGVAQVGSAEKCGSELRPPTETLKTRESLYHIRNCISTSPNHPVHRRP